MDISLVYTRYVPGGELVSNVSVLLCVTRRFALTWPAGASSGDGLQRAAAAGAGVEHLYGLLRLAGGSDGHPRAVVTRPAPLSPSAPPRPNRGSPDAPGDSQWPSERGGSRDSGAPRAAPPALPLCHQ